MSEMVERVARAIWAERVRACAENGVGLEAWGEGAFFVADAGEQSVSLMNNILGEARAAIEAMREPTPEMLAETLPAPGIHCDPKTTRLAEMALNLLEPNGIPDKAHLSGLDAARALIGDWYSMIDASLHEGEAQR